MMQMIGIPGYVELHGVYSCFSCEAHGAQYRAPNNNQGASALGPTPFGIT